MSGPGHPPRSRPAQDPRPITGTTPANPPGPPRRADLTAIVFRALYPGYDLHAIGSGLHVAVPRNTPCYAHPSIAAICRCIASSTGSQSPAAACRNMGAWPVLVGDAGKSECDTMLASPIILYEDPWPRCACGAWR